jgi:structural maintenance of chromosome 1
VRAHEQGIVISLKDAFYEKADALVGVCRDADRSCSATYTFDLERFGPPAAS